MSERLSDIEVLVLDCQATGATPAHGDVLELGWASCGKDGLASDVQSRWILPRSGRPIGRAVRELTGWSEVCLPESVDEGEAWAALLGAVGPERSSVPTVIHYARFELAFLRDLQARLSGGEPFPFDAICLHAVAARLFPDLPRRNIRALAGYLGHAPELLRRSAGHVEATAFIWSRVVPLLDASGVRTWPELKTWLAETRIASRPARRSYPLAVEVRRALPDAPGVYRFLRRNGDVLYVGKATNLRKRVAGHFKARAPATERGLELLTQVCDVQHVETPSLLEAALLEADEIKRLDPPYNVQLRGGERSAWFASRDLTRAVPVPDGAHPVGPLPSERSLVPLAALIALVRGEDSERLRAAALAVPPMFAPERALFAQGFEGFCAEHLTGDDDAARRVARGALALWLARGRSEPEPAEETEPDVWDLARVRRRLERNLIGCGLLVRRARVLCLLADAAVAFRERTMSRARLLTIAAGKIAERTELERVGDLAALDWVRPPSLAERRRCFDAAVYDRLRVLLTELLRVHGDGGEIALRVGAHTLAGERLRGWLRAV